MKKVLENISIFLAIAGFIGMAAAADSSFVGSMSLGQSVVFAIISIVIMLIGAGIYKLVEGDIEQ